MTNKTAVGFIGVGVMGNPMAINLMAKGIPVIAYDVNATAMEAIVKAGATSAGSIREVCDQARIVFTSLPSVAQHIRGGTVKGLAVTGSRRAAAFKDIPTIAESGFPGFVINPWFGLFASKGTPAAAVDRINKAVRAAFANPAVVKRLSDMGVVLPQGERLAPAALQQHTANEIRSWGQVLAAAGAKLD